MKIGILTFHRSYNYGAFMQCYSLTQKIKKEFPEAKVEVIDYTSEKIMTYYKKDEFNLRRIIKSPMSLFYVRNRNKMFKGYADKHLPLSDFKFVSDDYNALFEKIKGRYDVVVVGSDAVWNSIIRGFPNAYFLNSDLKAVKMSYAASVFGMEYLKMNEEDKAYIKQAFNDFAFIGARDKATEDLVRFAGADITAEHTCDPTMFLEMDKIPVDRKALEDKMRKKGVDFSKPLIGIMAGSHVGKEIKEKYGDKCQIVSLYQYNKYADVALNELEPFEWAVVFSYFKFTVTHFFHGTMLSLKNNVPVVVIESESEYNKNHDSKIKDLLLKLDLMKFYNIYGHTDYEKLFAQTDKYLSGYDNSEIKEATKKEEKTCEKFFEKLNEIK